MVTGDTIGPHTIVGKLGEGGMGEVWRARDKKLDREVAIKILPASFASDPDRLMRFEREARTLASLNHPHIAQIYGLEANALVMELVEGEDLSQRISRGPIPIDEALPIVIQIAKALEAAHDRGIVHRDLKPANVKVRPDGTVKVLDFGLAKALAVDEPEGSSLQQTITSPAVTMRGLILGTAAYMSPEQAKGKPVDKRSDIWAFGCVLYEMLTGTRPFEGETLTDVLAAVVRGEPDWTRLPAGTPLAVRRVLTRCLRKDVATRLRDAGDMAVGLAEIDSDTATLTLRRDSRVPRVMFWVAASVIMIGVAGAGWLAGQWSAPLSPQDEPIRASIALPPGQSFAGPPVVSPDGRRIVVALFDDKQQAQLWQLSLAATGFRPMPNTAGANDPFWSPDSQWIAFVASGELRRIDVAGDRVETIARLPGRSFMEGAWGPNDAIVIATAGGGHLWRVNASGGAPTPATTLDVGKGETLHNAPSFVGDRGAFVFQSSFGPFGVVKLSSLEDPASSSVLMENALVRSTAGIAGDRLLFSIGAALFVQKIDLAARRLVGTPQRVQDGLPGGYASTPSGSPRVLIHLGEHSVDTQLQWRDRAGKRLAPDVATGGRFADPEFSPRGERLVYATTNPASGRSEIVALNIADGRSTVVASADGQIGNAVWSPDGHELAYIAFHETGSSVYRLKLGSTSPPEQLIAPGAGAVAPSDWTADGARLVWKRVSYGGTGNDVMMLPLSGDPSAVPLVSTPAAENTGKVSPDGRWLAYSSDDSGRNEIYIQPFPKSGQRWQVSRSGGSFPRWRADGQELFFYNGNELAAAEVALSDTPRIGAITRLFTFERRRANVNEYPYAVTPDGQRFVVNVPSDDPPTITIVVNWQAALRAAQKPAP